MDEPDAALRRRVETDDSPSSPSALQTTDTATDGLSISMTQQQQRRGGGGPDAGRSSMDVWLWCFVASVGSTLATIAVLSRLVHYTRQFEHISDSIYIWLNLAVYVPLLPISLLQARYDGYFDILYTSKRSFAFRGHVGFAVTILCLVLLPSCSSGASQQEKVKLLGIVVWLGTASGVLQGSLRQLASRSQDAGRLSAAVTSGMQASAVAVLLVDYGTDSIFAFYVWIAILVALCWMAFHIFLKRQTHVEDENDETAASSQPFSPLDEPLLLPRSNEDENIHANGVCDIDAPMNDTAEMNDNNPLHRPVGIIREFSSSYWELSKYSWTLCVIMFLTLSSSMAVASWFNRFQGNNLPQILFYTRIFGDLLGRPATLLSCSESSKLSPMALLAVLRLLFVPYFFLVLFGTFPPNESVLVIGVFVFAFSSGYIVTKCYQVAPILLPSGADIANQSKLLNVCFSASVLLGLVSSLLLSNLQ